MSSTYLVIVSLYILILGKTSIMLNCFIAEGLSLGPLVIAYEYVIGLGPRPLYICSIDKDSM